MMRWIGPNVQPKIRVLDAAIICGEIEFVPSSLYAEQMCLVEALENWLPTLEVLCGDRSSRLS